MKRHWHRKTAPRDVPGVHEHSRTTPWAPPGCRQGPHAKKLLQKCQRNSSPCALQNSAPWKFSRIIQMWHWGTWLSGHGVMDWWLDHIILVFFSNLNGPVILWKHQEMHTLLWKGAEIFAFFSCPCLGVSLWLEVKDVFTYVHHCGLLPAAT